MRRVEYGYLRCVQLLARGLNPFTKLAIALNSHLEPIRERRAAVLARPHELREILFEGSRRARAVAAETMARVRDAMRMSYT